jgi:Cdc6-like AAA superfamily ATPase
MSAADDQLVARLRRHAQVAEVFTPGAPVDRLALFAGRLSQIRDVINAVGQRGQHVVLYGERGVGKTSLANILSDFFEEMHLGELRGIKINCNTTDDFRSIWRNVFRELDRLDEYEGQWSERPPDPEDVRYLLQAERDTRLIVIDELDRLEDNEAMSLLADTIKTLSDNSVNATLVLVGVADSIDELIGDHQSIERALVQIPVQRMSLKELREIIRKGLEQLGLSIEPEAHSRIAYLSEGLPHYTHLLGLHATQRAIMEDRKTVTIADVEGVIGMAVEKAAHSIRSAYQKATRSARPESQYEQVLLACALAEKDELGYFTASAVREPMSLIMGRTYEIPAFARHLNQFAEPIRGCVLQKAGESRRYFYRFANPLLQPFVILSGLAHGLISEELLVALQNDLDKD